MKITKIRLAKLTVPLVTPFKTALRTVEYIDDLVVVIETDTGDLGYGSAAATPQITGDTHESMIEAVNLVFRDLLLGADIAQLDDNINAIQMAMAGNVSIKAALEIALYDLWGKFNQAPLYQLLGGSKKQLTTDITISINDADTMVKHVFKAIEQGFKALKIKVGTDIKVDIARVKHIYQALIEQGLQQQIMLRLDVNQAWSASQTVMALEILNSYGVKLDLVEQPVKADDLVGMGYICQRTNTLIMADESAFNLAQVQQIITNNSADIINIKLMKTGGLSNAIKIADFCQEQGVSCMIGCMLEGSIAVTAAAHLASAKARVITRVDLDGPALGQYDPVLGGADFKHANIYLNDKPGLGIERISGLVFL